MLTKIENHLKRWPIMGWGWAFMLGSLFMAALTGFSIGTIFYLSAFVLLGIIQVIKGPSEIDEKR